MDRALKERIIGAVVLVAIVVLVVPVFLDGPVPEKETISKPVLLPGQSRDPGERRTVVLERNRDRPLPEGAAEDAPHPVAAASDAQAPEPATTSVPAGKEDPPEGGHGASGETVSAAAEPETGEPSPGREEPADAPARPDPRPEPAEDDAAAGSATGMWAVQIGSFSNKANADRLAAKLREEGYAAFLSQHQGESGQLHRVRIGPQEDRNSAETVAARLHADGFKGQVVPHP